MASLRKAAAAAAAGHRRGGALLDALANQLAETRAAGLFKAERLITSAQDTEVTLEGHGDRRFLNFCANNYLGLSNHPELVKAAHATLDSHGYGLSSVRFICGTQDIHKKLEQRISQLHRTDDTILYPSCFDANAGIFEAVLTAEDAVLSDALNHASIIDGIRLCKARRIRYKHADMAALEEELKNSQDCRSRMIVTDGVFSMDGEVAPLPEICALAEQYDALVFVDDCHASGFMGESGAGTPEYFNVTDKVDVVNSTLGKALGGATGGFTTGRQEIVDVLRQKGRPYLFSNTLAPAVVGASLSALDLLQSSSSLRDTLRRNTQHFRSAMAAAGFALKGVDHPIVPVMLGDAKMAAEMAARLLEDHGVYVVAFSYPVVPRGEARIRVQLSAAHTPEQLEHTVAAFKKVGGAMGVIPKSSSSVGSSA